MSLIEDENAQAKEAWDRNAAFWNERMGEGNDFFNVLLWPAVERLLKPPHSLDCSATQSRPTSTRFRCGSK